MRNNLTDLLTGYISQAIPDFWIDVSWLWQESLPGEDSFQVRSCCYGSESEKMIFQDLSLLSLMILAGKLCIGRRNDA